MVKYSCFESDILSGIHRGIITLYNEVMLYKFDCAQLLTSTFLSSTSAGLRSLKEWMSLQK